MCSQFVFPPIRKPVSSMCLTGAAATWSRTTAANSWKRRAQSWLIRAMVAVTSFTPNSLRYTQACSVTGGQDYALLSTSNTSKEAYDFLRAQNDRQFLRLPGKGKHVRERPFPLECDLVKESKCPNGDMY